MISYRDVCEAKTKKEMLARFDKLLKEVVKKYGGTKESNRVMQLSNIGYFSGYYDKKTWDRVHKWLGATHPIFGASYPTTEQALNSGKTYAKEKP